MASHHSPEQLRLDEDSRREKNWKRWGPYLSERQWGTVREDYSANGDAWNFFPHDHARSRAYRWGEDGLLGITDRECRMCFALALWNGRDPILKERLFGLSNPQGNHGEDPKEWYWYLDSTPTHSYMRALYKYPQGEFPYARLVVENAHRSKQEREFEISDTGVFDGDRYFDIFAEYAKAAPEDICIRLTIENRGPDEAELHVLPTLWFRNTWTWHDSDKPSTPPPLPKPSMAQLDKTTLAATHATLGTFRFDADGARELLFTENESNVERLFGSKNGQPYVKDAFHEFVIRGAPRGGESRAKGHEGGGALRRAGARAREGRSCACACARKAMACTVRGLISTRSSASASPRRMRFTRRVCRRNFRPIKASSSGRPMPVCSGQNNGMATW